MAPCHRPRSRQRILASDFSCCLLLPRFDDLLVQYDADYRLMRFQWLRLANLVIRPALVHGRDLVVLQ